MRPWLLLWSSVLRTVWLEKHSTKQDASNNGSGICNFVSWIIHCALACFHDHLMYFLHAQCEHECLVFIWGQRDTMSRYQKTWHNAICFSLGFNCKSPLVVWAKGWAGSTNGWRGMQPCIGSVGSQGLPPLPPPLVSCACPGCFSHSPASFGGGRVGGS